VIAAYLGVEDEEVEKRGVEEEAGAMSEPLLSRSAASRPSTATSGAARRRPRRARGRDRHADRRQRRRQVDADDDDLRQPRGARGPIVFDGRDITALPTHEIMRLSHRPVAGGPPHLPAHDGLENLQMGAASPIPGAFRGGSRAVFDAVPAPEGAARPARRHAVGRRAADAGDRPRADEPPRLLLLDEPSLGLAPLIVKQIFARSGELNRATA
jgi:hypothetical protein